MLKFIDKSPKKINEDIIQTIIQLVIDAYAIWNVGKKAKASNNGDISFMKDVTNKLQQADKLIANETAPYYVHTSEGWDLMLSNTKVPKQYEAPTRESIRNWLTTRCLA